MSTNKIVNALFAIAIVLSVLFVATPAYAQDYTLHMIPDGASFPSWMCNDGNQCTLTTAQSGFVNMRLWANSSVTFNGDAIPTVLCDVMSTDLCVSLFVPAGQSVVVTNSQVVYASLTSRPAFWLYAKYHIFAPMIIRY